MDVRKYNFGSEVDFISYDSEDEWHALRKLGIGGSDAGAIMELNEHMSPLKLYKIKKGEFVNDDTDNVYIKKGKDLESLIFEKYVTPDMEKIGFTVIHPEHIFLNKNYPWLRANCDGIAVRNCSIPTDPQENIVIEIKWVSEWSESNWNGDEYCGIPASYYAQVQHYMTVTGAGMAYLYAMFDKDWKVKRYDIPYDFSFALKLVAKTKKFYDDFKMDIAPKVKAHLDKDILHEVINSASKNVYESTELDSAIAEYISSKEELKALEQKANEAFDKAIEMYVNGARPTSLFRMRVTTHKRSGFNSKKFQEDNPDLYEQYRTYSEYTRTVMGRK